MRASWHIFPRWQIHALAMALFAMLSAAGYLLGLGPVLADAAQRDVHARALAAQHRKALELQQSLTRLKAELAGLRQALDSSPLKLQPADHVNQRLADLTRLATARGLQFSRLQPGALRRGPRHAMVPIEVAGSGSYVAFAQFLHELHQTHPDMCFSAFQIAANPTQPGQPASFRCELLWYVQPPANDKRLGR